MPVYTYRREDGTTFDYRQKFSDDPLTVDPETGLHVTRVIQPAGVIFKGSGFYVNDSKSASHSTMTTPKSEKSDSAEKGDKTEKTDKPAASTESKPAAKAAASTESASKVAAPAAAD